MPLPNYRAAARRAFDAIHATCPSLRFAETTNEHVDINIDIPVQDGLAYEINLNLQGDSLHFHVGDWFWVEWFPCDDEDVEEQFIEAVHGFLSGRYRIVKVLLGNQPFVSTLEKPSGSEWQTVATSSRFRIPWPWLRRSTQIVQNAPGIAA